MKSAAGKRPPDGESGPGKEAIRPRQLCLGESQQEGAHRHAALPAEVGTTLIQKMTLLHRSALKNSAQFCQTCSRFHSFILKISLIFPKKIIFFKSSLI